MAPKGAWQARGWAESGRSGKGAPGTQAVRTRQDHAVGKMHTSIGWEKRKNSSRLMPVWAPGRDQATGVGDGIGIKVDAGWRASKSMPAES